ncbi:MAG: hypothetical protein VB861_01300, partial [Planctomycetaceae bacterium]
MTDRIISQVTSLVLVLSILLPASAMAGGDKPYDPGVKQALTCARPLKHCSRPGSPSTAYMLRPVTTMRTVVEVVYEPTEVKMPRTVYETVYENQIVTLHRMVCETQMQEQKYEVCRTVSETSQREITETFRRPVWETIEQECQYQERRLVRETSQQEIRRKVYRPVTEQVTRTVCVRKVVPVTSTRTVTEDKGRYVSRSVYHRGPMLPGLGQKPCG